MKTLEKGQDKIQKIADQLRRQTLEPAQEEAQKLIEKAKVEAEKIIHEARMEGEKILNHARLSLEQEKNVFHSSLEQASKQSIETLKQVIENDLFNPELEHLLKKELSVSETLSRLIQVMISAIEKDGLSADLEVVVSQSASVDDVNQLLGEKILQKIKNQTVTLGNFEGGVKIKLKDQNLTLDVSDQTLNELLARYVRKDFRKLFFKGN